MIELLHELEERRLALQRRAAIQRLETAELAAALAERGAIVDRAVAAVRKVPVQPVVMGAAALVLLIGPGRLLSWAVRGAAIVGMARRVAALLRSIH